MLIAPSQKGDRTPANRLGLLACKQMAPAEREEVFTRRRRVVSRRGRHAALRLVVAAVCCLRRGGAYFCAPKTIQRGGRVAFVEGGRSMLGAAATGGSASRRGGVVMASWGDDEPETTRVEDALRLSTREINALTQLLRDVDDLPAPIEEVPAFPPVKVELLPPSWDALEADRSEIARINQQYYECLSNRDVPGVLKLWRPDGDVTLYNNEDSVVKGKGEIDKHLDGKFRLAWAANKNTHRQQVMYEEEKIVLRGINAFVTNKEVWENVKTKERKVTFSTKVLTKCNGEWSIVHQHSGDGAMAEISAVDKDSRNQAGANKLQGMNILGALGMGNAAGGSADGLTGDGTNREIRTIITPEGHRIIISGGALGAMGGGGAQQTPGQQQPRSERSSMETKEMLLKALIDDLSKNGKTTEMVPLQLGRNKNSELFSASASSSDGRGGENLTKKTVAAIRQLCVDGRITVEQKRKLIFSVIRSTKAEETSQVEMAYDLLVENALAGEENALDEFADQCRIIVERFEQEGDDEDEDEDDEDYEVYEDEVGSSRRDR